MKQHIKFDAFLSHSHEDAEWVESLATQLEDEKGLHIWLDKWVLVPGKSWQQAMARGLDEASSCAVIVGEGTQTGWFRQEVERALNKQATDEDFRVIPVLAPKGSPENLPEFVELRTWADFREGCDVEFALHVLTQGIRGQPIGRWIPPRPRKSRTQLRKERLERNLRDIHEIAEYLEHEVRVQIQMKVLNQYLDEQ